MQIGPGLEALSTLQEKMSSPFSPGDIYGLFMFLSTLCLLIRNCASATSTSTMDYHGSEVGAPWSRTASIGVPYLPSLRNLRACRVEAFWNSADPFTRTITSSHLDACLRVQLSLDRQSVICWEL